MSSNEIAVQEQDNDQRTDLKDEINPFPSSPPAAHMPDEVLEAAERSHAGSMSTAELLCKALLPRRPLCKSCFGMWNAPLTFIWLQLWSFPMEFLPGKQHRCECDQHPTGELTKTRNKGTFPPLLPAWRQFCSFRNHQLLRTISAPSLSLWKVPALSLAVSANRSIPSHVSYFT